MAAMGGDSAHVAELRAAADALLRCGKDRTMFVNESEGLVHRFERALIHLRQQRYPDEVQILDALPEKEQIISVLVDATRNRPPSRSKTVHTRKLLAQGSQQWAKAWKSNRTADAVLGGQAPAPAVAAALPTAQPVSPKPPIPFCLELLALGAVAIPLLAAIAGHDCVMHWVLFLLGLLLTAPWVAFEVATKVRGHRWMLERFIAGSYTAGVRDYKLGWCWRPSRVQILEEDDQRRGFVSFGRWWRASRPPAGVRVLRSRTETATGEAAPECLVAFASSSEQWANGPASMEEDGILRGLPRGARFDGDAIVLAPEGSNGATALLKVGCWRLEFVRKALVLLAVIGVLSVLVAAIAPPHLSFSCRALGPRLPLRAVFLLDGSGSIGDAAWMSEKQATKQIIRSFEDVYGTDSGALHFGLVQFSTSAVVEVPLTDDPSMVARRLDSGMRQQKGGTDFAAALRLCQQELTLYTKAGSDTFDICVLITDGADGSGLSDDHLKQLVQERVATFGIFVGSNPDWERKLHHLIKCGRAAGGCDFFASVSDFLQLKEKAREVAEAITRGSSQAAAASRLPAWLACFLLAAVPFLIWWVWLLLPRRQPNDARCVLAAALPGRPADTWRLRTVGMNQDRGDFPPPGSAELTPRRRRSADVPSEAGCAPGNPGLQAARGSQV